MKVTVVIPAFNAGRFLSQALESAFGQRTSFVFDLLVGDDGSTDDTAAILRAFQARHRGRMTVVTHPRNVGYAENFASLLQSCRSKYVALLDSDDVWLEPYKLQRQIDFLDENLKYSACAHTVWVFDASGGRYRFPPIDSADLAFEDFLSGNHVSTSSVVYRNGLFGDVPAWTCRYQELDWLLHLLNLRHGPMRVLPEVLGAYRIHGGGLWSGTPARQKLERIDALLSVIERRFGAEGNEAIMRSRRQVRFALRYRLYRVLDVITGCAWGKVANYLLLTRGNRRLLPRPWLSMARHFAAALISPRVDAAGRSFPRARMTPESSATTEAPRTGRRGL